MLKLLARHGYIGDLHTCPIVDSCWSYFPFGSIANNAAWTTPVLLWSCLTSDVVGSRCAGDGAVHFTLLYPPKGCAAHTEASGQSPFCSALFSTLGVITDLLHVPFHLIAISNEFPLIAKRLATIHMLNWVFDGDQI